MSCNSLQWKRNKQKKNTHTHILSHSVVSDSLRPHGLQHAGSSVYGDSPSKNTRVGCPALLQGIFPTQGLNPVLPHCRWILYHLSHHRSASAHIYISESLCYISETNTLLFINYTSFFRKRRNKENLEKWKQPPAPVHITPWKYDFTAPPTRSEVCSSIS